MVQLGIARGIGIVLYLNRIQPLATQPGIRLELGCRVWRSAMLGCQTAYVTREERSFLDIVEAD